MTDKYGRQDEKAWLLIIKIFGDETTPPVEKMNMLPTDKDSVERRKRVLDNMNSCFLKENGYNVIDKALAKLFIVGVMELRDGNHAIGISYMETALTAKGASIEEIKQITKFASRFPKNAMEAAGDPLNTNRSEGMLSNRGGVFQMKRALETGLYNEVNVK